MDPHRRDFLSNVGKGMLVAGLGPTLVAELGLSPVVAEEDRPALTFGAREPLVALLQETPADKLLPLLVAKLQSGVTLRDLVTAGALANARTFGGEDYIGYHTFMALLPAWQMSRELPKERQALPILKVLHRNASRIQAFGGRAKEVLRPVAPIDLPKDRVGGEVLREATRAHDKDRAEGIFSALIQNPGEAFDDLQYSVDDDADVHRVVLAWRARAMLDLAGPEQAHTFLRQSVRFCARKDNRWHPEIRELIPKLLDQHKLLGRPVPTRKGDDALVERLAGTLRSGTPARAAEAVAAALGEGFSLETVGEAITLAACHLVLADLGMTKQNASATKPEGSVHGASIGVHASDAVNAWRNIARVGNARSAIVSLIAAAYFTADGGTFLKIPHPLPERLEKITPRDPEMLLREAENAITGRDQAGACAYIHRYGELGLPARPVLDLLLRFGVSEDGALHAEKYYATVVEEFTTMRPAFRWRQLVALARVTASEYGFPAAGFGEACKLLKV